MATLAWAVVAQAQPAAFVCGDADGSGAVTVSDGVQVLRMAAGQAETCGAVDGACDVDGDGRVTVTDGVKALRLAATLPTFTRCGGPVAGDESVARSAVSFPGCEDVTAEAQYCLTIAEDLRSESRTLSVLGLESGRLCRVHAVDSELGFWERASSLGWRGEVLYVCADEGLVRMSLRDGRWEGAQLPCQAVTANDATLFLMREPSDPFTWDGWLPWGIFAYPSYEAAIAGQHQQVYEIPTTSRLAATRDRLVGAWHSTDTVGVVGLTAGTTGATIGLEGYDDWIHGIAVTDDGELVVSRFGPDLTSTVTVFDVDTGARIRELSAPDFLRGLACVNRRASVEH